MEKKLTKSTYIFQALVFVVLVAIDQFTKVLARKYLITDTGASKSYYLIKNVLCFHYLENRGSVWGILQDRINFLLIVSLLLFAILLFVYIRLPKEKHYLPLIWIDVFMLAGAVGNTIDRIFFGYVTDFIYVEIINFPIFNFADCCITVAAALTIVMILTRYKEDNFSFFSIKKKKIEENGESNTDNR
jgi:signal peptidase II